MADDSKKLITKNETRYTLETKSASFTAEFDKCYLCSFYGSATITLPAIPSDTYVRTIYFYISMPGSGSITFTNSTDNFAVFDSWQNIEGGNAYEVSAQSYGEMKRWVLANAKVVAY